MPRTSPERAGGVEHAGHHDAHVAEDGEPHRGEADPARSRTATFAAIANAMFCLAIPRVRRAMRTDAATLEGMSSMRTTSAASMAASEPMAPMAIPTSARASTGASLMPSPLQLCQAAPSSSMSAVLPTATLLPLTVATMPLPATSVVSRTEQSSPPQGKASRSASAMGCAE